jgi:hypothetical protein
MLICRKMPTRSKNEAISESYCIVNLLTRQGILSYKTAKIAPGSTKKHTAWQKYGLNRRMDAFSTLLRLGSA